MEYKKNLFDTILGSQRRRLPKWLLAVELFLLVVIAYPCFLGKTEITFSEADMFLQEQGNSTVVQKVEERGDISDEGENPIRITTKKFFLYPGSYRVRVNYQSQVNHDSRASFQNGAGTVSMESDARGAYVYFDFPELLLRDSLNEVEQTVQIQSPLKVSDLVLQINYLGNGELSVYSIQLEEVVSYKILKFLGVLGIIILGNRGIYTLLHSDEKRKITIAGLLMICGFGVLPFLVDFAYHGHDYMFHLNRITCLADELRRGNFFPAIYTTALNGYGYANPLFYGQVFLYLPAILYACGFSLWFSYNFYVIVMTIGTIFLMYHVSMEIFQKTKPALLTTALYTLNPVRLSNVLVRAAVGEFSAQAFLPLTVLGFYRIYTKEKNETISWKEYLPVVIGLTCTLLTHMLSFVMSAMIIAAVCLLKWKKTFEKERFAALCKAAILTLLLNLSTLVPFLTSYGMPMVVNERVNYIQGDGAYLSQLFTTRTYTGNTGSIDNAAGNEMSYALGFAFVIGFAAYAAILILLKTQPERGKDQKAFQFSKWCFVIALISVLMSTSYLPFNAMDILPKPLYTLLTIYQFPWRWRTFAVLFGSFCTVYAVENIDMVIKEKGISRYISLLVTIFMLLNMGEMYERSRDSWQDITVNNSYHYSMEIGAEEYLIFGTDPNELAYTKLNYDEDILTVSDYIKEGNSITAYVKNNSTDDTTIEVPLICYDNYLIDYENGESFYAWRGGNNCVTAMIPGNYEGIIQIKYHFRSIWKLAIFVSSLVLVSMISYGLFDRCRKKTINTK